MGGPQHWEIIHYWFGTKMKKSLIQTQPNFGEEPFIPSNFLQESKGFPYLSFNEYLETLISIPHFIEKTCYFEMWLSQFFVCSPRFSLGVFIQLLCCLSEPQYPFVYRTRAYRVSPKCFFEYLVRTVLVAIHNTPFRYLHSFYIESWLYRLLGTWYIDYNWNLIYHWEYTY